MNRNRDATRATEGVVGEVKERSRQAYRSILTLLVEHGAEAILLGCTEIMLVGAANSVVPLNDTTRLHAEAAVRIAVSQNG